MCSEHRGGKLRLDAKASANVPIFKVIVELEIWGHCVILWIDNEQTL